MKRYSTHCHRANDDDDENVETVNVANDMLDSVNVIDVAVVVATVAAAVVEDNDDEVHWNTFGYNLAYVAVDLFHLLLFWYKVLLKEQLVLTVFYLINMRT